VQSARESESVIVFSAYEDTLGKSHQMTRQAKLTTEEVQRRQKDFTDA